MEKLCGICKSKIAKFTCKMCGNLVCENCFNKSTLLCMNCRRGKFLK